MYFRVDLQEPYPNPISSNLSFTNKNIYPSINENVIYNKTNGQLHRLLIKSLLAYQELIW